MNRCFLIFIFTCACIKLSAQVNIITTICGDGTGSFGGDGGQATRAKLDLPDGLCIDRFGNMYIADADNNRIRKINLSTGIITTVAGTSPIGGVGGFSGDGGPATNAELWVPEAVFNDTAGNVYIADAGNNRIRKIIVSTGIITTVAGSGPIGILMGSDGGDGGPATNATLNAPSGLCLDKNGNIYIADYYNNKVRKVDALSKIITTIAGTGVAGNAGNGEPASNAQFSNPDQVFVDYLGNLFVCDQYNHTVRKISASTGIITVVAGSGAAGYWGDGGPATSAKLNQPSGVFVDNQSNIFIAEYINGTIRKVNGLTGIISTVAGTGTAGYSGDGGPATDAQLIPGNVFLDAYGTMYIADYDNNRVRKVYDTTLKVGVCQAAIRTTNARIYPNPTTGNFTVEDAEGSTLKLFDLFGQNIFSAYIVFDKEVMNIGSLCRSVYIVRIIRNNGMVETTQLIKQ